METVPTSVPENHPDQLSSKIDAIEKRLDGISNTITAKLSGIMRESYPDNINGVEEKELNVPPYYSNLFGAIKEINILLHRIEDSLDRIDSF